MHQVTMPRFSQDMESGLILEWRVREGERVRAGQVLAEIDTDKATIELESPCDGRVASILHGNGAEVPVGEVIAIIAEE